MTLTLLPSRLVKCCSLSSSAASFTASSLQEIASTCPKGVAKVVLKKGKTQLFKHGSPMVYSGAVDRIIGRPPPKTGDVVLVADGTGKPIGWGLYNSVSMFCVRLLQLEEEATRDPASALNVERLLEQRIDTATELRRHLGLPSTNTNAYRLVNSEGDRLSGLIVDVFDDVAVVASSAAWVEKYKPEIEACLNKVNGINYINWRPTVEILKEEGIDVSKLKHMPPAAPSALVKVKENGINYSISLEGQKTGFYADQRENRQFIATITQGKRVLDMCCYSGGFALNAARGGAASVTGVDSSLPALELAKENIILNDLDPETISFLKQDATDFMKSAAARNELWDIVILDPPKLAPRREVLQNASRMYRNLNALAMRLTKKGGLLMTCSCSAAMTQSGTFMRIIQGAAAMADRKVTLLRQAGVASDHPIDPSYPEGAYLSNILLRVL
uniref:PUA domain-containing protein n=2 Tax=Opuntia streptacantha TaxID=393608 RepID=A0A7C8YUN4_OPUST